VEEDGVHFSQDTAWQFGGTGGARGKGGGQKKADPLGRG
jgi:hypothetical protein